MLEEILKKESIGEEDLKILVKNLDKLSHADLVRFGFATEVAEEKPVKKTARRTTKK